MDIPVTVDEPMWVEVVNESAIADANRSFTFGDKCSLRFGDKIIRIGQEGKLTLARLIDKAHGGGGGTLCPVGTEFLIPT